MKSIIHTTADDVTADNVKHTTRSSLDHSKQCIKSAAVLYSNGETQIWKELKLVHFSGDRQKAYLGNWFFRWGMFHYTAGYIQLPRQASIILSKRLTYPEEDLCSL